MVSDAHTHRRIVLERRRRSFSRLLVLTATTLVVALIFKGPFWLIFLTTAAWLGVYVSLLLRWKAQADQAAAVVRQLPTRAPEPAFVEQPLGTSSVRVSEPVEHELVFGEEEALAETGTGPWRSYPSVRIHRWDG